MTAPWSVRLGVRSTSCRGGLGALALLGVALAGPGPALADIASDHPGAILVFPKMLLDTADGLDTMIRITNVSSTPLNVYCFYVNSTPQCSLGPDGSSCFPSELACFRDIGGQQVAGKCLPQWQETDFVVRLTREQPTGWLVSGGESVNCAFVDGVCSNDGTTSCDTDSQCGADNRCVKPPCLPLDGGPLGRSGPGGEVNEGAIPLSPSDPFIGELKCVAVDESLNPVPRNDLIGQALIGRVQAGPDDRIQVAGYNAIGIPALVDACLPSGVCEIGGGRCKKDSDCPTNDRNATLVLGGPDAEYEGCPNVLILDHYFDGAVDTLVRNFCQLDGTCNVTGTACAGDAECVDNVCLAGGACSVTATACAVDADCANTCGVGNVCTLSGEHCASDADCTEPTFAARVATDLTLVPCTEDFENQDPSLSRTVAQFLVFNEFEQRFSTSRTIDCFKEIQLSNIETTDNSRSIFSAGVEGTLTGQSRIRGVLNQDPAVAGRTGNGLLAVSETFRCAGPLYTFPTCGLADNAGPLVGTTAKNLHFQGRREQSDFIYLP